MRFSGESNAEEDAEQATQQMDRRHSGAVAEDERDG